MQFEIYIVSEEKITYPKIIPVISENNRKLGTIEIDQITDLIELRNAVGYPLIVDVYEGKYSIEIYNDFIE